MRKMDRFAMIHASEKAMTAAKTAFVCSLGLDIRTTTPDDLAALHPEVAQLFQRLFALGPSYAAIGPLPAETRDAPNVARHDVSGDRNAQGSAAARSGVPSHPDPRTSPNTCASSAQTESPDQSGSDPEALCHPSATSLVMIGLPADGALTISYQPVSPCSRQELDPTSGSANGR